MKVWPSSQKRSRFVMNVIRTVKRQYSRRRLHRGGLSKSHSSTMWPLFFGKNFNTAMVNLVKIIFRRFLNGSEHPIILKKKLCLTPFITSTRKLLTRLRWKITRSLYKGRKERKEIRFSKSKEWTCSKRPTLFKKYIRMCKYWTWIMMNRNVYKLFKKRVLSTWSKRQ